VHLVLWAIDRWLEGAGPLRLLGLRALFRKPAYLDREVGLDATPLGAMPLDAGARLVASGADGNVLEAAVQVGPRASHAPAIRDIAWPERIAPDQPSREEAAAARGELELAIDGERARAAFPRACARLGLDTVAELLATTRLVGMRCPGLHSLFGGMTLEAGSPEGASDLSPDASARLAYEVADARPKYSMLTLRVRGPLLAGSLDTFHRPPPSLVAMRDAEARVTPGAFTGRRAFVVGGTRGLGEAFAKLLAAGGAEVCLTYHRGAGDAARVADDIRASGRSASAIAFDVLDPALGTGEGRAALRARWPLSAPPTHLYYLATPTLYSIRMGATWKAAELELLIRYFVTGLHATVAATVALGGESLVVWTPSTTMLDAPAGGAAYCAAKASMEELCRHLPALLPVTVHAPRLGRVDTDQTAGLISVASPAPLEVALEHLTRIA